MSVKWSSRRARAVATSAGDEPLDVPDGFALGLAFSDASGDVGARGGVTASLGDGDEVERAAGM